MTLTSTDNTNAASSEGVQELPTGSLPIETTRNAKRGGIEDFASGGFFRKQLSSRLDQIQLGQLKVSDAHGTYRFGTSGLAGEIIVHDERFYRRTAIGGSLAAAESYLEGDWDSPDLVSALRVLASNAEALQAVDRGVPQLLRPLRAMANWLIRNSRRGSRRNIASHYDLSNEFFALMLDPTMTYSSGIFPSVEASMEQASAEKYDRICRKLQLKPQNHLLEIGTGWGGFTEHAVTNYGCQVTTTTISQQQHDYAAARFARLGLGRKVNLLMEDYRDLRGSYDRLVSIEMVEAVGQQYLPAYFAKCSSLLKPTGAMMLQAITIPDNRYDQYRKSVDFIQRYVFPGGFLPSPSAITDCLRKGTDFSVNHVEDFGTHYARTLSAWWDKLWSQLEQARKLGFDERFFRLWQYYLSYCEAGFMERQIGVSQWLFTKPRCEFELEI